jgi:hypothetical protein
MVQSETQILATVMRFIVKVPVLSVQIKEQDPRVSMMSNFLTKTFTLRILSETMKRQAVMVDGSP